MKTLWRAAFEYFTCRDCGSRFPIFTSEAYPTARPLCDGCVTIANERARLQREAERAQRIDNLNEPY